jgi:hypothetical protein
MAWRSILDATAAEIVRAWFCPHLHRHDTAEGYLIHCRCLHCRETWRIPLHAYREPKGVSPMKKNTDTERVRKFLGLGIAATVCFGAVATTPKPAHAFFGDVVGMASDAISLIPGADIATETIAKIMGKGGRATEGTQVLNNVILGGQLGEQIQQTFKLFGIEQQTLLSVLRQPINTYGAARAASMIARDALASQGMPYDVASALSEHARLFFISPDAALNPSRVVRTMNVVVGEQDRAILESVSSVASQRDAANALREAIEEAVELSQSSVGQTQGIQAGNQINAAIFSQMQAVEAGQQAANYMQARQQAAQLTEVKMSGYQRHADTRDFLTGPYPAPDFGGGAVDTVVGNVAADAANGIVSGVLGM